MTFDSLIFDMDGTLWDNVNSYVKAWNMGLERTGLSRRVTRDDLLRLMGMEIGFMIKTLVPKSTEKTHKKLIHNVFDAYNEIAEFIEPVIFPGVKDGLKELSGRYKLFLLSNCEEGGLVKFMKHTQTTHLFTDYIEYGQNFKSKNVNMKLLIERNNLKSAVYIGDTNSDSLESQTAGIPFVFVSYGFGHTNNFALRFDSFSELTKHFTAM